MRVEMGQRILRYPDGELGELRDANDLLHDPASLRQRLAEDGYLLIRQTIDREKVLAARSTVLEYMAACEALEPGSRPLDGVMGQYGKSVNLIGHKKITHDPAVRAVLEGEELFAFYQRLFGETARTFDYKWLRAVGQEKSTGAHYDVVYMGRGSQRLLTCWIPFGDLPVEHGTLCICEGSHNAAEFKRLRETYGKSNVDRDEYGGMFTQDPLEITQRFGGHWKTTTFQAGDILTFGMYTLHASTTNKTDKWRLSCDVRFQPAADPVDERWVGENPVGHYAWKQGRKTRTIDELRPAWGV